MSRHYKHFAAAGLIAVCAWVGSGNAFGLVPSVVRAKAVQPFVAERIAHDTYDDLPASTVMPGVRQAQTAIPIYRRAETSCKGTTAPVYPQKALNEGVNAAVRIAMFIAADGQITGVKILSANVSNKQFRDDFIASVSATVKTYQCHKDNQPYVAEQEFDFRVVEEPASDLIPKSTPGLPLEKFNPGKHCKIEMPVYPERGLTESVSVEVRVQYKVEANGLITDMKTLGMKFLSSSEKGGYLSRQFETSIRNALEKYRCRKENVSHVEEQTFVFSNPKWVNPDGTFVY